MTVKELFDTSASRFRASMPHLASQPTDQQIISLLAYYKVIWRWFMTWLLWGWQNCPEDTQAKKAFGENLHCEWKENHPFMLLRYIAPLLPIYQTREDIRRAVDAKVAGCQPIIKQISQICLYGQVVDSLLVTATLERLSLVFIPEIGESGEHLGLEDDEYVRKHGVADIAHADELEQGCQEIVDLLGQEPSQEAVEAGTDLILALLA